MAFVNWADVPASRESGGVWMIYALIDPRDDSVRYVGVTNRPLNVRLSGHIKKPTNRGTRAWIADLSANGITPMIRLLSAPRNDWEQAERGWIAWFRERGALLNVDPGGICRTRGGKLIKRVPAKARAHSKKKRARVIDPWAHRRESQSARLAEISRRQMRGG